MIKKKEKKNDLGNLVGILFLIVVAGFWFFPRQAKKNNIDEQAATVEEEKPSLPSGWSVMEKDNGNLKIKLEKESSDKVKPIIVLIESTTKETDPQVYVDKLVRGLRAAFPSMKINRDEEKKEEGQYQRSLNGWYYNGANKVAVEQRIIIENEKVSTLTASFWAETGDKTLAEEIETIFASLL